MAIEYSENIKYLILMLTKQKKANIIIINKY